MAWPVVAAIAASAAGSALGGLSSASAQRRAAALQRQTDLETLAQNRQFYDESRGSTGHAILPVYFGAAEEELAGNAADAARTLFGTASNVSNRSRAINSDYAPVVMAGDQFLGSIYDGSLLADRQSAVDTVKGARTGRAKSRAGAIDQALGETLAALRAGRLGRGFRGESTFDITRAQDATMGARRAAATEFGDANLENAMDDRALREADVQLRLGALDMPFSRARSRIAMETMPLSAQADAYSAALSPLNFFRIGTGSPPQAPYRTIEATPNAGMVFGSALAQGGSALGQYFAQQQAAQQMRDLYTNFYGGQAIQNSGFMNMDFTGQGLPPGW
jgi:hypothetical protein